MAGAVFPVPPALPDRVGGRGRSPNVLTKPNARTRPLCIQSLSQSTATFAALRVRSSSIVAPKQGEAELLVDVWRI
eukprot:11189570-Lingulodinium_polyedra.AAC.1